MPSVATDTTGGFAMVETVDDRSPVTSETPGTVIVAAMRGLGLARDGTLCYHWGYEHRII